jgi:4-amino-4-deoxy-L-arabinose transferase-like glycosyltransferase
MLDFAKPKQIFIAATGLILAIAFLLRFINFGYVPPSLYWEEVALGYDAYSIALTGKDHHGNPWPIVAFESFGDWKPSLYFYSIVPFIKLFGLNSWAVRAPSLLSGVAIVTAVGWLAYLVAKRLNLSKASWYALAGLCVAAYSPWAIQFSRAGWEVNLATALVSWGMVLGLQVVTTVQKGKKTTTQFAMGKALGAVGLLVMSVYAYHGTRLVAPLLGLILAADWWWSLKNANNSAKNVAIKLLLPSLVAGVLMLPVLLALKSPQVTQRFAETSIFSQLDIIVESNEAKAAAGNSFVSSVLYHRYLLFGREVLRNYFDHFNLNYLVVSGDTNPRHSSQYGGILLYPELFFLAIGVCSVASKRSRVGWIIVGWWLVSILPAALTTATPHALRTLPGMPAALTLIAVGLRTFFVWFKGVAIPKSSAMWRKPVWLAGVMAVAVVYSGAWLVWYQHYLAVYSQQASSEWQYGYQEMVTSVNQLSQLHPDLPIYITREQGRPAMYYWFFSQTEPARVQAANATAQKDQGEFVSFEEMAFPNTTAEVMTIPAIVASSPAGKEELVLKGYLVADEVVIKDLAQKPVWSVYRITQ